MNKGKSHILTGFVQNVSQPLSVSSTLNTLMFSNHGNHNLTITAEIWINGAQGFLVKDYTLPSHSILDVIEHHPIRVHGKSQIRVSVSSAHSSDLTVIYTSS